MQIGRKEVKLTLDADKIILHRENPQEYTHTSQPFRDNKWI